ncbi:MAG: DUF177 domain-containing protein, partial [Verrucomicrobiae bacterium]|nr:DUF177 domain-containing protein [Verrucomicrobiae bacterium]
NLPAEGRSFEGEEPATILDIQDPGLRFEWAIHYKIHATLTGHELVAVGRLWTQVGICCVRCLKDATLPLDVLSFVAHQEVGAGQEFADLTENMREDILLALPQNPLCQPGCRGLCPSCGQDLNESTCACARKATEGRSATAWSALDRIRTVKESHGRS